ncbi:MAG: proton-conducting transporter membrane subunit [Micromonosporaceae bacterium]
MSAVFAVGLALLCAAALLGALIRTPMGLRISGLPFMLATAGSACLAMAGGGALAGRTVRRGLGSMFGLGHTELAADHLSGLFLLIAFGAAVPVCAAAMGLTRSAPRRGRLGAACALTLLSVAVVITAQGVFVLLFAWETLTIAFYLLAGFERDRAGRSSGALVTLVFGKISGVSLLAGLLLLAARSHTLSLADLAHVAPGAARTTAYALLLLGFGIKVGVMPTQVWLPRGYAAAPGAARAVMAGVAVNAGFYGLWRTFALLGPPPGWLTGILLALASATAIAGIAHAAVQANLPRVIAYSSVENTGLILTGFCVALIGATIGQPLLVAAGMLAATLQMTAHTLAKSLLYTAGAGIEEAAGSGDLDLLRGAARRSPWSGTGLAVGSLTLAGLPLTAGFVSEWFLLESLMQQFRVPGLGFRLLLAVAGAAVALTVGFAGVTFVRLTGLVVLGPPIRTGGGPQGAAGAGRPHEGWLGRAGIGVLAAGCLAAAALTPLEIRLISVGLSPVVPARVTTGALTSPWVVGPVFGGFSILSPSWLWIVMPSLLAAAVAATWLAAGGRMLRVRRVPAWRSATAGVEGADQYTAFGYTNPTRRVLAGVLLTRAELRGLEEPSDSGAEPGAPVVPHLRYTSDVVELVEEYIFRPAARPVLSVARAARRLQSGRLDAYLAYMLIALVAVLAVVTAIG